MSEPHLSDKAIDALATLMLIALSLFVIIGVVFLVDAIVGSKPALRPDPLIAAVEAQTQRLDALEKKLDAIIVSKGGLTVQAPAVYIFETPNLGGKKP